MAISVEGDGGARPVEVLGHRHPCYEDLAVLPLALPCGELRRGSTVDHVAVVDGWEALVFFASSLVFALIFLWVVFLQTHAVDVTPRCYGCINHMHNMSIIIYSSIS